MRPVALTSFKKRCIVPATVQMFLQNSVLEVEGPLGKAELHLKTYDNTHKRIKSSILERGGKRVKKRYTQ